MKGCSRMNATDVGGIRRLILKPLPPDQIDGMNVTTFFGRFTSLLKDNPPGPFDYPAVTCRRMPSIHLRPQALRIEIAARIVEMKGEIDEKRVQPEKRSLECRPGSPYRLP